MPTEDCAGRKDVLFICDLDGEYHPISAADIEEAVNALDIDVSEIFKPDSGSIEIGFDMKPADGLTLGDMALILMGFDEEKIMQNNWRRLHGIPMKRRKQR